MIRPTDSFVSTTDAYGYGVNSAFFCAEKNYPFLRRLIEEVVEAVNSNFYGFTAIDITGPIRFGNALKRYINFEMNDRF